MFSGVPLFPSMVPDITSSLWFRVDAPKNEDSELKKIENAHQTWLQNVSDTTNKKDIPVPIGKTIEETSDEEEDLDLDLNSEDSESTTETDSIDTNSTSGEDTREDLRVYRRV